MWGNQSNNHHGHHGHHHGHHKHGHHGHHDPTIVVVVNETGQGNKVGQGFNNNPIPNVNGLVNNMMNNMVPQNTLFNPNQ